MDVNKPLRFVVIGAGVAGIEAASKLSEAFPDSEITLLEKYEILSGSSGRTPGRMGLGFHYANDTAKQILEASIAVQRKYPDFLMARDKDFSHPHRHGRYYITKTSSKPAEEILDSYVKLQAHYQKLVDEDPLNECFGPPSSFFRILDPIEYEHEVNAELIDVGIETNEHLFDFIDFSIYLRKTFKHHPHIRLYEGTDVYHLSREYDGKEHYFQVHTRDICKTRPNTIFQADFIINSTWENIEYINSMLDIPYIRGSRTNRLKAVVQIFLPKEAQQLHSSFFCMGPFGMFSNLGDKGLITFAEMTNLSTSSDLKPTEDMKKYVSGLVSNEKKLYLGNKILDGIRQFMPILNEAYIQDVRFGIVQTQGHLDIKSLSSASAAHHHRNYLGVREEMQGLIANPAVKLFNFVKNGEAVLELVGLQLRRELLHKRILEHVFANDTELYQISKSNPHLRQYLKEELDRRILPVEMTEEDFEAVCEKIKYYVSLDQFDQLSQVHFQINGLYYHGRRRRSSEDELSDATSSCNSDEYEHSELESLESNPSYEDCSDFMKLTAEEIKKELRDIRLFPESEQKKVSRLVAFIPKLPVPTAEDIELKRAIEEDTRYYEHFFSIRSQPGQMRPPSVLDDLTEEPYNHSIDIKIAEDKIDPRFFRSVSTNSLHDKTRKQRHAAYEFLSSKKFP